MLSISGIQISYLKLQRNDLTRIKDSGLIKCTEKFLGKPIQTFREPRSRYKWQNDYIFVTKGLEDFVKKCYALDLVEMNCEEIF